MQAALSWKHQSQASFNTQHLLRLWILALFSNQQDSLVSSRCKMGSRLPVAALTWISARGGTQEDTCDSEQDLLLSQWGAESTQSAATPVQSTFHPHHEDQRSHWQHVKHWLSWGSPGQQALMALLWDPAQGELPFSSTGKVRKGEYHSLQATDELPRHPTANTTLTFAHSSQPTWFLPYSVPCLLTSGTSKISQALQNLFKKVKSTPQAPANTS